MNIEIEKCVVTNDGQQIGIIVEASTSEGESTCYSPTAIPGRVKGAINEAWGSKLKFVVGPLPEDDAPPSAAGIPATGEGGDQNSSIDSQTARNESFEAVINPALFGLDRLHALAKDGKIPAAPATHPAMGDKTPEFVEWFKAHATAEEIEAKYPARRGLPSHADYQKGEKARHGKLPGEKNDTAEA